MLSHTNRIIHRIEKTLLILIIALTMGAVAVELFNIGARKTIVIADILLLFLYTEVISMVGIFYQSRSIPVIYPLFIAITALSRLIVLQSKDMAPETILYEAAAIAILAVAVATLRFSESKYLPKRLEGREDESKLEDQK